MLQEKKIKNQLYEALKKINLQNLLTRLIDGLAIKNWRIIRIFRNGDFANS